MTQQDGKLNIWREIAVIVPIFAAILFLIPLMWPTGDGGVQTSGAYAYLFSTWVGLIVVAAITSKRLKKSLKDAA